MKSKQLPLLTEKKYLARKTVRAIGIRQPNHVTFKARLPILRANHLVVKQLVRETQRRYGIRIRALAIMDNHLHFLIQTPSREAFQNSLRFLSGQIALKLSHGKLWLRRCWSRVVTWGRDYLNVKRYIEANPEKAGIFDGTDVFTIRHGYLEAG
jgi:REP element-mobilizing transposase RayT